MGLRFTKTLSSQIEDEIRRELDNYVEALEKEADFEALKAIRDKIKILEEVLKKYKSPRSHPK